MPIFSALSVDDGHSFTGLLFSSRFEDKSFENRKSATLVIRAVTFVSDNRKVNNPNFTASKPLGGITNASMAITSSGSGSAPDGSSSVLLRY